jgi:hypothetical protein
MAKTTSRLLQQDWRPPTLNVSIFFWRQRNIWQFLNTKRGAHFTTSMFCTQCAVSYFTCGLFYVFCFFCFLFFLFLFFVFVFSPCWLLVSEKEVIEKVEQLELNDASQAEKKKKKKKKNKKKKAEPSKPDLNLLGERQMMPHFENLDLSTELKEERCVSLLIRAVLFSHFFLNRANHPFWASQPVLGMKEGASQVQSEPVEVKTLDQVQKEPLGLPEGFEWVEIDVSNDEEMTTIYELLRQHCKSIFFDFCKVLF